MSIVKKMHIQGVRSFSPHDNKQQMIEFQTPLCLILGVNGSGKTTIIESLKYAITNKFPPNCLSGSSFVNDPKLTNGYESMAVVKLEVLDGKGNKVNTTRRVKVTVKDKNGGLTKKEMDATIKITDPRGVVKEVNNKCADTKSEMCRVMGVSEAILNHVLFCHQEDSCWPLDEAKKVKEKFDSIFNTTMYIKCLEHLTKQDKEFAQKIKLEGEKLKYIMENRKTARKKKTDLENKEIELKAVTDQIIKFEKDLTDMESRLRKLQELEKEYTEIASKVSAAQAKLDFSEKQVTELRSNIKEEFAGDIETLRDYIKEFTQQNNAKNHQQKKLKQQLLEKDDELKTLNAQQKKYLLEEGKLQQEEAANQKRVASVAALVSETSAMVKKLKENLQDTSFSQQMDSCIKLCNNENPDLLSVDAIVKALSATVRAKDSEFIKAKSQFEKEEKEMQKSIDELRTTRASLETEIVMQNKKIQENKKLTVELKERLQAIEGSNETLTMLEEDEEKFLEQINNIQKSGMLDKYETDIKGLSKELKDLERNITKISDNVDLLTKDQSKVDQIAIFSRQKTQKQNECNEIMRRVEDDLKNLLGTIPETNLGKAVDKKRESIMRELNQNRGLQKKQEKEITVTETELKRVDMDLKKKEAKVQDCRGKIEELLGDRSYDDVYEEYTQNLDTFQKDNYYSEAGRYLYKQYIKKLTKKDCCPLCRRDIETKQKLKKLISELEAEIEKMQENEPVLIASIENFKTKQQELLNLKPIWDEKKKLETEEIPELKKKKISLDSKLSELTERMDELNGTVAILDNEFTICGKCSKDVGLYESAKKEVKQREDSIANLESSRDENAKQLQETTNLSDLKIELQDLKLSLSTKQSEKDSKSDVLNRKRNELTKLQDQKNKVREDILKITSELQNREALEIQKKELEESNKQLLEVTNELGRKLPAAKTEIMEAEKNKSSFIETKDKRLQELRQEKEVLEKKKSALNDLARQIGEYEKVKSRFAELEKCTLECKRGLRDCEREKQELQKQLESVKNDISNHELKQRDLQDNLSYKQKMEDIETLKRQLAEEKKILEGTTNRGATAEKRNLSQKHQDLSAKMNQHRGSHKEIRLSIHELKKELNEPYLVNAETEFTEKFVKKTIYEKTQRDIRRYKTALDHAIMQFHSKRMETINKLLFEYWSRIYKGNDIDTIQIRTDSGTSKTPGTGNKVKLDSGKSKKNYNYRVVMVRHGIELDMRGRCSAGQRVLASIIIRIALAESFSTQCGIITLDEPTTNLDQRNINSLADALSKLADKMSTRKNFQLIVITHDQEFTERLSIVDSVEKYWKISRDEMGFSQIRAVSKRGG